MVLAADAGVSGGVLNVEDGFGKRQRVHAHMPE
jgi:hypothetical protein